jgi:hypothetical protein
MQNLSPATLKKETLYKIEEIWCIHQKRNVHTTCETD